MATIKDLLSAMISKINKAPKTVNGVEPDENGNITSSWNDLPDKPFGEELKPVELCNIENPRFSYGVTQIAEGKKLVPEQTYYVRWGSEDVHECVAFENDGHVVIGNVSGDETGKPFLIAYAKDDRGVDLILAQKVFSGDLPTYIVLSTYEFVPVPISPKYLPEPEIIFTVRQDPYGDPTFTHNATFVELATAIATGKLIKARAITIIGDEIMGVSDVVGCGYAGTKRDEIALTFNVLGGSASIILDANNEIVM